MSGDLETAAAALDGLDTDGGDDDADILLARGKYAYFTSDLEVAQSASDEAQRLVLAGERDWKVLDLVRPAGTARAPLGRLVRSDARRAASDA